MRTLAVQLALSRPEWLVPFWPTQVPEYLTLEDFPLGCHQLATVVDNRSDSTGCTTLRMHAWSHPDKVALGCPSEPDRGFPAQVYKPTRVHQDLGPIYPIAVRPVRTEITRPSARG